MADFPEGIYFNRNDKAPDFVVGSVAVIPEKFMEWLHKQEKDEKGYVRLDVLKSKQGNIYMALNTWKPENKVQIPKEDDEEVINIEDIPF